jgi:hypothetical protein
LDPKEVDVLFEFNVSRIFDKDRDITEAKVKPTCKSCEVWVCPGLVVPNKQEVEEFMPDVSMLVDIVWVWTHEKIKRSSNWLIKCSAKENVFSSFVRRNESVSTEFEQLSESHACVFVRNHCTQMVTPIIFIVLNQWIQEKLEAFWPWKEGRIHKEWIDRVRLNKQLHHYHCGYYTIYLEFYK